MKNYLLAAAVMAALCTSCYQNETETEMEERVTPLTLQLSQGFSVEQTTVGQTPIGQAHDTRATSLSDASMTDLWIYDFDSNDMTLLQTIHLTEGLDEPTILLHNGRHTLSVIASRGAEPTCTDEAVAWQKPHDTFAAQLSVTANGAALSKTAVLNRKAARLTLNILDKVPANIDHLEVTLSQWGTALAATTLVATELDEYTYVTNATQMAGRNGVTINFYGIATTTTFRADVSITAFTATDTKLGEASVTNVPFTMNSTTTLTGNLFSASGQFALSLDGTWGEGTEMEF